MSKDGVDMADNERQVFDVAEVRALAMKPQGLGVAGTLLAACDEIERLRVQLAGCGVAALGEIHPPNLAEKGSYGWSASYGDVLKLRSRFDRMQATMMQIAAGTTASSDVQRVAREAVDADFDVCRGE